MLILCLYFLPTGSCSPLTLAYGPPPEWRLSLPLRPHRPAQNLVILVPARRARRFAGRDVSVSGRFGFNPHVGRLIRIASVTVAH